MYWSSVLNQRKDGGHMMNVKKEKRKSGWSKKNSFLCFERSQSVGSSFIKTFIKSGATSHGDLPEDATERNSRKRGLRENGSNSQSCSSSFSGESPWANAHTIMKHVIYFVPDAPTTLQRSQSVSRSVSQSQLDRGPLCELKREFPARTISDVGTTFRVYRGTFSSVSWTEV